MAFLLPADRSTMTMLVPMAFEWFEEWQEEPKGKRGDDYETLKSAFLEASMSVVMKLFPHLEDKVGLTYRVLCLFLGSGIKPEVTSLKEGAALAIPLLTLPGLFASLGGECDWRIPTDQPVLSGCSPGCCLWG